MAGIRRSGEVQKRRIVSQPVHEKQIVDSCPIFSCTILKLMREPRAPHIKLHVLRLP